MHGIIVALLIMCALGALMMLKYFSFDPVETDEPVSMVQNDRSVGQIVGGSSVRRRIRASGRGGRAVAIPPQNTVPVNRGILRTSGMAEYPIPIPIVRVEELGIFLDPSENSSNASAVAGSTRDDFEISGTFPDQRASYATSLPRQASKGEEKCYLIASQIIENQSVLFNYRDPRIHNPDTGRALEIDIFYPELRFGIEYNGEQHYKNSAHFGSIAEFQSARDAQKRNLTSRHGITLISIPYTYSDAQIKAAIADGYDTHVFKYQHRARN